MKEVKGCCLTDKYTGYIRKLYRHSGRYYRIERTRRGNMYDIYVNEDRYARPEFDVVMCIGNMSVRAYNLKEVKELIDEYEVENPISK